MGISDQHHEQSDLEDEKVLNEKWLKSVTALNVAKLELTQLKKKNLELETQAKVELMQLEKKELYRALRNWNRIQQTKVIVREHVFVQVSFCVCVLL